eukprot:TRINITY_DN2459_c0_g1_i1.p1 TRINITY_DN2459_c0_g1~~TRINITY_DN2459_c0_g1_i1.p1  ORF type:complete len:143 (+),score=38.11 TRINITY_DN2459_c0_g1_i1:262-690(+)
MADQLSNVYSDVVMYESDDLKYSSPVFFLPQVMPLKSDPEYSPFEADGSFVVDAAFRGHAADYSYDNFNWQSQAGFSSQQLLLSQFPQNDDNLPLSPTDSLMTSSSEGDADMAMVSSEPSFGTVPAGSCFSSIAAFAQKGYF